MIVEIQCLPQPAGTAETPYSVIEAAIAAVQASGLKYEVSALGTTFEGEPDEVWAVTRRVHEACLAAGARSVVSLIKVEQAAGPVPPTIESLTRKYR